MNLVVATDRRYYLDSNGNPLCTDGSRGYGFWQRYLQVFDSVTVVARQSSERKPAGFPVVGDGVSLFPLADYLGPQQYFKQRKVLAGQINQIVAPDNAYLLRVPGNIGSLLHNELRRRGCPYAVEVIADPAALFAKGSCNYPLRSLIRWNTIRQLRNQCRNATAASYVTSEFLQRSYPPGPGATTTNYSSVEMPDKAFVASARELSSFGNPPRLLFVGTMSQLYKGVHVLIEAVAQCVEAGTELQLRIVGDGKHQPEMESLCRQRGIQDQVEFCGRLPAGDSVRTIMDDSDLCVLPSFAEGVPRVLIEAMGRGLPCIGTDVGGISELLPAESMVPARQVQPLANKILQFVADKPRLVSESQRNLKTALSYHCDTLCQRRNSFYRQLLEATQGNVRPVAA